MLLSIAQPVHALRLVSLAGWMGCAMAAQTAAAAGFRPGAYVDTLGTAGTVCVTKEHMAAMTATAWKRSMQKRGMDCTVTDSDRPMPGHETWKASCVGTQPGTGHGGAHLYQFTVHADGERLVVDSGMKTSDGRQMMKNAFFGDYQAACTPGTPPLDVWTYLDGAGSTPTPEQALARQAIAIDLIRCGNVFNGLSLSVAKARQDGMRAAAAAVIEAAVQLHPADGDFHLEALKRSAPEVSAQLVGASPEKRLALYQSCSPYLESGGIDKAVQSRAAEAAVKR